MNVKQANKNANTYINEVEELTKSLQSAYITDGLTPPLAEKYSTKAAIKAITTNACNEKVKLIMQSGQFNNMNEAVAKFVNCCTEAYGQQNSILYFSNQQSRGNYRGNNRVSYRGNYRQNSNRQGRGNYNGNRRNDSRNANYRGHRNHRGSQSNNSNYVRMINDQDSGSENSNQPLSQ